MRAYIQDIISQCWHADPAERPPARDVVRLLTAATAAITALETACKRGVVPLASKSAGGAADGGGGCCVIS